MSGRLASSLLLGPALAASLLFARAQQAVAPPASASPSSVDAMQLYLVVHDKRDKPVLDLKPEDLTLTDDGSPVRLENLELVDQHRARQLVSFVFDSFPAEKDELPQKHSSRIATARDAALRILSMLSESGFEFSVFNIDSRLHLQQGYTVDIGAIEKAIQTATGPIESRDKGHAFVSEREVASVALNGADSTGKRVSARERLQAQSIFAALQNSTRIAQDRHISPSLSSILALVQAQQNLPERKTIIYLSSMHQEQIKEAAKQAIESILGSANQAGIGINVVDGTALGHVGRKIQGMDVVSETSAVSLSQAKLPGNMATFGSGQETLEVVDDPPVDTDLKHLAEATGGTYFNGNLKVLHQLVGDMTTYYDALRDVGTEMRGNGAGLVLDVGNHRQVRESNRRVRVLPDIEVFDRNLNGQGSPPSFIAFAHVENCCTEGKLRRQGRFFKQLQQGRLERLHPAPVR